MRDGRAARLTDTKNTAVTNIIVYHKPPNTTLSNHLRLTD